MGWFDNQTEEQYRAIGRRLDKIDINIAALVRQGKAIMTKMDELNAALDELALAVTKEIEQLRDAAGGATTEMFDAAIKRVKDMSASLKTDD